MDNQNTVHSGFKKQTVAEALQNAYSGSFTIKSDNDCDDDTIEDLKEYLEEHLKEATVSMMATGRKHAKSQRAAYTEFGENIIAGLGKEYIGVGDHRIHEAEMGDGLAFQCINCDWEAAFPTTDITSDQLTSARQYVFGHALDAQCVDSSDNVTSIDGIKTVTPDKSDKQAIGRVEGLDRAQTSPRIQEGWHQNV